MTNAPPPPAAHHALKFATALGLAAPAALACSLPATLRVCTAPETSAGALQSFVALASVALGPMVIAIVVLRGAHDSLRAFGGARPDVRAFGVGVGLSWAFVVLSLLGSVLRATTHNHALAGVTYAFAALAAVVGVAFVTRRLVKVLEEASSAKREAIGGALAVSALGAAAWVGVRFAAAVSRESPSPAAAIVVDVLAFALSAFFAARPSFAQKRVLAFGGVPAVVLVTAIGFSLLRHPPLRAAIQERALLFAPLAGLVPKT